MIIYLYNISIPLFLDGSDFSATDRQVTLSPGSQQEACAAFPVLDDSLGLEEDEVFLVGLQISGTSSPSDSLLLNGGRAELVPQTTEARVVIVDSTGEVFE